MKLTTGKLVVAFFVVLGVITVLGVLAIQIWGPTKQNALGSAVDNATVAASPFTKFRTMQLKIGKTCKPVLVASTEAQQNQGLRGVRSLAPYQGMLFAFPDDQRARFTMADTVIPLEITFYDAKGQPISTEHMVPCPGTDLTCPTYGPNQAYRYALETEQDKMPPGALSTCS